MNDPRGPMIAAAILLFGTPAFAQAPAPAPAASKPISTSLGVVAFPAKGQTQQQQSQDEGECYAWAKGQTGVDPMAPPPAAAQPSAQPAAQPAHGADGSRLRGAARGAAAGAVIGEVADDDAGKATRPTPAATSRRGPSSATRTCTPSFSMDAGAFGARLTPRDAYRFARARRSRRPAASP
jgi:hypothetical protein